MHWWKCGIHLFAPLLYPINEFSPLSGVETGTKSRGWILSIPNKVLLLTEYNTKSVHLLLRAGLNESFYALEFEILLNGVIVPAMNLKYLRNVLFLNFLGEVGC